MKQVAVVAQMLVETIEESEVEGLIILFNPNDKEANTVLLKSSDFDSRLVLQQIVEAMDE